MFTFPFFASPRCEECDKEFKYVKEYHFHQAVNHKESIGKGDGDEKEDVLAQYEPTMYYKCKTCDKTFKWMSQLKKHAETHKTLKKRDSGSGKENEEQEATAMEEGERCVEGDGEETVVEMEEKVKAHSLFDIFLLLFILRL